MSDFPNHRGARILPFRNVLPRIDGTAWVADGATVIGDVEIGPDSSIWFGVVVRGDVNEIRIGARSNVQDGSVLHCTTNGKGTYIGDDVTVGHMAMLHACTLESGSFVGMKACLLDGVVVERGAVIAAGALVTPNKRVPAGELWAGSPARFVRKLSDEEQARWAATAPHYVRLSANYKPAA
jgi:carbonic anhydrase/acetyltransferase-like protein (isoleucine patch superfamily)